MITLYIKKHKITGLKYFGKTTNKNVELYQGSGIRWLNHLKKHGNDVDTEIYGIYDSILECEKAALDFSIKNNIVESNDWANLKNENGKDGNPKGIKFSEEHKQKISQFMKGKCHNDFDELTRVRMSEASKIRVDKQLNLGIHPWQGERGSSFATERNMKRVKENTHNFQGERGSKNASKINKIRIWKQRAN